MHDLPREPALEADALTLDVCPGVLQQDQRVGISAEIDTHLLQDRVRVVLDQLQPFVRKNLDRRKDSGDEWNLLRDRMHPSGLTSGSSPCSPTPGFGAHALLLCRRRIEERRGCGRGTTRPSFEYGSVA